MNLVKIYVNQLRIVSASFSMHHMYLLHRFIVLRLIKQLLNSLRVYGSHLVSDSNDVSQIQFFGRNSFGEKG